ncbi:IS701 family transposase [Noviherbaspirillum pedocola]|uniref:IS701 family transposase n=1 Tax=Noviherbaspirillum pedocola TaxID=2801341 RepID=UPI001F31D2FF|nr:IS701 family transposase [Noviherbaspirillum pedocola]
MWQQTLDDLLARIGRRFGRKEMQQRARDYLQGLLQPVERKNGWQLAEVAGQRVPYSIQHLLDRARWDADAVRDDVRIYSLEYLADPNAVLVVDETGFLKKGQHSVGVARQYSGTAGRIENCQIGVFLAYVSNRGRVLIDRELYLPREWTDSDEDRIAAKVPETVSFATKPELARRMIERAIAADVPFRWVTGDEVYGNHRRLRLWLEQQQIWHVLALASNQYVWLPEIRQVTVQALAATASAEDWVRLAAGDGAKGPRLYDWARLPLLSWQIPGERWLLLRRSLANPQEIAYYIAYVPRGCPLEDMVRVAGSRWAIEECFEAAKGEVGLDQYEVRSWHGWYRHITLAMTAHAYLTVLYAISAQRPMFKKKTRYDAMQLWKQQRLH